MVNPSYMELSRLIRHRIGELAPRVRRMLDVLEAGLLALLIASFALYL
jgi:hypothetical protein